MLVCHFNNLIYIYIFINLYLQLLNFSSDITHVSIIKLLLLLLSTLHIRDVKQTKQEIKNEEDTHTHVNERNYLFSPLFFKFRN